MGIPSLGIPKDKDKILLYEGLFKVRQNNLDKLYLLSELESSSKTIYHRTNPAITL